METIDLTQIDQQGDLYDKLQQSLVERGVGDAAVGAIMSQLNVDAMAVIHEILVQEVTSIQNAWSLLEEGLDPNKAYDEDALKNILANVLRTKPGGSVTYGRVRLVSDDNSARTIPTSRTFLHGDGHVFIARGNYTLLPSAEYATAGSIYEVVFTEMADGRYEAMIEVESQDNGAFTVSQGAIFTTDIPGISAVTAINAFTPGVPDATVETMVQDIPATLGEMSYNSPAGTRSLLQTRFAEVQQVKCLRSGDAGMLRDRRNPFGISSKGGDVYVVTATSPQVTRIKATAALTFECRGDGSIYNGGSFVGSAVSGTSQDVSIGTDSYVNLVIPLRGEDVVGLYYPAGIGVLQDNTSDVTTVQAGAPMDQGVTIMSRSPHKSTEYGQVIQAVVGQDVAFSAMQSTVVCRKAVLISEAGSVTNDLFDRLSAWVSYWKGYHRGATQDQLAAFAAELGEDGSVSRVFSEPIPVYADVIYMPHLHKLQQDVSASENRAWGADMLIRAPHLASVSVTVRLSHSMRSVKTRESYIRAQISEYINSFGMGAHDAPLQPILDIIKSQAVTGIDRNIGLEFGTTVMTSDSQVYQLASTVLAAYEVPSKGMTADNTLLFSDPENITFIYR